MAAAAFAAITTEMLPVGLLPVIAEDLGVSEARVGLLVSGYALVVAVGSIPLTALVVRWPRRRVLGALLGMYATSNAVLATTSDYWVALGCRLLAGLAHAAFFSVVVAIAIGAVSARQMGRAVAVVNGGNAVALSLGVPLGTALGTALGWRWAFAVAAVVLVGIAAAAVAVLPRAAAPAASATHVPVLTAARGGPLLVVAATVMLLTLGHYTVFTYVSPLLIASGVGREAVSLVLLGYGIAGIVGLVLSGVVVDRHPRGSLQGAAGLLVGCLLVLSVAGGSAVGTATVVVLWGVAFGTLPTLMQTAALRAVPRAPDAAPAMVNATWNIGIGGGAFLGGRQLELWEVPSLAATGSALAGAALLLLLSGLSRSQPTADAT